MEKTKRDVSCVSLFTLSAPTPHPPRSLYFCVNFHPPPLLYNHLSYPSVRPCSVSPSILSLSFYHSLDPWTSFVPLLGLCMKLLPIVSAVRGRARVKGGERQFVDLDDCISKAEEYLQTDLLTVYYFTAVMLMHKSWLLVDFGSLDEPMLMRKLNQLHKKALHSGTNIRLQKVTYFKLSKGSPFLPGIL